MNSRPSLSTLEDIKSRITATQPVETNKA